MTRPMMTGMSAPSPTPTLNGHAVPPPPLTPAVQSGPAPTGLPGTTQTSRDQARAERIRIMDKSGKPVRWMLRIGYGVAAIVAGIGQWSGLGNKLPDLEMWLRPLPMIATEGLSIIFAAVAAYRRKLGENAYVAYGFAILFALFATAINFYGHFDVVPFLAWFFAGFSVAGFVVFMVESAFERRDALWLQKKIDDPPPLYGLWLELTERKLVARAKQLATEDPGLGRAGSLEAARVALAADRRREAMQRIVRSDLGRVLGAENAELMVSVIDPDQLADEIQDRAQLGRLAEIYARRIDPEQIEEAHARERAERRKGLARFTRRSATPAPQPAAAPAPQPASPIEPGRPATRGRGTAKVVVVEASKRSNAEWAAEFRRLLAEHPARTLDDSSWLAAQTGLSTSRVRAVKRWMRDQEGGT